MSGAGGILRPLISNPPDDGATSLFEIDLHTEIGVKLRLCILASTPHTAAWSGNGPIRVVTVGVSVERQPIKCGKGRRARIDGSATWLHSAGSRVTPQKLADYSLARAAGPNL